MHTSITLERVIAAVEAQYGGTDNPGFCRACGADHDACEPDAENYECHECGARGVDGAENILMSIA